MCILCKVSPGLGGVVRVFSFWDLLRFCSLPWGLFIMRDTVLIATKRSENIDRPYSHQQFCTKCSHKKIEGFVFIVFALGCLYTSVPLYGEISKWRLSLFLLRTVTFFCKQIQSLVSWCLAGWWIANPARRTASKEMLLLDYEYYIVERFLEYIRSCRVNSKTNRKSKIHDWQTIVLW